MKQVTIAIAIAAATCWGAMAQTEEFYIFRNDNGFDYYKAADVEKVEYNFTTGNQASRLTVRSTDGSSTQLRLAVVDSCVTRSTAIPDFHITLDDYPDATDLFKTDGFTKKTIYAATLRMDGNGMYDDLPEQQVEFRGRGNSTWNLAKTPYRFKLSKKTAVCGLQKAKSWALIANYLDPTLMRNTVALWVAGELGLPYTNHSIPCNVYLNGLYKGAYMLTEKIGINSGSVDIDEDKGMLFELDVNYDEDYQFQYAYADGTQLLPVMVKDPDLAEIKPDETERAEYLAQWQADFSRMADVVIAGGDISEVIDLDEAARFVLVFNLACNREINHPKSVYMHKTALGDADKYHMGPVWDFDWSTGFMAASATNWNTVNRVLFTGDGSTPGAIFFKTLARNPLFMEAYRPVWEEFLADIYPRLDRYIDQYAEVIEPSARRDGLLWPSTWTSMSNTYAHSSFDTAGNREKLKQWLAQRVAFLKTHKNLGLY